MKRNIPIFRSKYHFFLIVFVFMVFTQNAIAQITSTYTSSGTFTVPAGVTSAKVECWGGGGAGGRATGSNSAGGGGAGGSYVASVLSGPPGSYTVTVGAAKTSASSNTASLNNGNPSWFGAESVIYAPGGAGGTGVSVDYTNGAAGSGTTNGCIGTVMYAGGNGSTGNRISLTPGGAGGGGAGSTGTGGDASAGTGGTGTSSSGGNGANGVANSTNGATGMSYGGAGSGGKANSTTDRTGGSGAQGLVKVTYLASITGTTTLCAGSTTTLSNAAPGGTWNSATPSVATVNSTTGVVTGVSGGTSVITYSVASGISEYDLTVTTTVTVIQSIGGTISGVSAICLGESTGTLTLSGYTGTILRWERNRNSAGWENAWGGTNSTFSEAPYSSGVWQYRVVVQNGSCTEAYSSVLSIAVSPTSVGGYLGTDNYNSVCLGSSIGTLTLNGSTGSILRWEKRVDSGSWENIANTQTTYTEIPSTSGVWEYRALVQSGSCPSVYSGSILRTVNTSATITLGDSPVICQGTATASLPYSGTTGSPTSYSIDFDAAANAAGFVDFSNYSLPGSPISVNVLWNIAAGVYNGSVSVGSSGCSGSASSFTITVNPMPTLTGSSQTAIVCAGSGATINLTGLIPNTTSVIEYKINDIAQAPVAGIVANGSGAASFTTANLTADNNGQILQITGITITSATPGCTQSFSKDLTLSVSPTAVGGTVAPVQTICSGSLPSDLSLSGNTGSVVKWQKSSDAAFTSPVDIAGTSVALFGAAIGNLTANTYVRAVVQSGACSVAYSSSVLITVNPVIANNTVSAAQSICTETTPVALAGTLPTGGSGTYTYLWESSTTSGIAGFVTASGTSNGQNYTPGALSQTTWYRRTVTSGACSNTSTVIQITITDLPAAAGAITGSSTAGQGQNSVAYSVAAIADAISYVWAYSGTGATITGTTNSITISFALNATSGNLTVRGTNACGNGTVSANFPITITVYEPASFWYKADGTTTFNGTTWNDETSNGNNATNSGGTITLANNSVNFNPSLTFTAVNRQLLTNSNTLTKSLVIVTFPSVTTDIAGLIGTGADKGIRLSNDPADGIEDASWRGDGNADDWSSGGGSRINGSSGYVHNFKWHIVNQTRGTGINAQYYVGGYFSGRTYSGSIAEVMAFSGDVPEQDRVETYLAVKYGITLGHDYLAGPVGGGTVYSISGYGNDIAGLGNDATYGLNQKVSASINTVAGASSRVVLATNDDFTSGNLTGRTSLADGQYLICGHNGGTTTAWTEDGSYDRVNRFWRVQNTGNVGQVYVQVNLSSYPSLPSGRTFKLLADDDGNLANGGTTAYSLTNSSGSLYTVPATFPSGTSYFTIGYDVVVPAVTLAVSPASIAENSGVATFTVMLSAATTRIVTLTLTFSGTATGGGIDYTPSASPITIPVGSTTGILTVTSMNDELADASETVIVGINTVTNGTESGTQQATVTITDDDYPGITVFPTSGLTTGEAGSQSTFTVVLSAKPTANVTLGISTGDSSEGTVSPASLIFTTTNWNTEQTVTITGVDDALIDGNMSYTIVTATATSSDPNYNGINPADISVTNTDNDGALTGSIAVNRQSPENTYTPEQLVQNILVQGCLTSSNVSFTGASGQIGHFTSGASSFPIAEGILLSTGNVTDAEGPNFDYNTTTQYGRAGDSQLNTAAGLNSSKDAAVLEFDFVPAGNMIEFNYIFASEEYAEYVGQNYNDAFAFFLSGPGIAGTINIALIPGTSTPVSINNVHGQGATLTTSAYPSGLQSQMAYPSNYGHSYSGGTSGPWTINPTNNGSQPPLNSSYYVDNGHFTSRTAGTLTWANGNGGVETEFDGRTTVLSASHAVTACETYHIKIVVADAVDDKWDSGVFLEGRSFSSDEVQIQNLLEGISGDNKDMYEGCAGSHIRFSRATGSKNTDLLSFNILLSGTAQNGIDYVYTDAVGTVIGDGTFPTNAFIPIGQNYVDYYYKAQSDGTIEGNEDILFRINNSCPCDVTPTYFEKSVNIIDVPQIVTSTTEVVQCQAAGNPVATISVNMQNGLNTGDYEYQLDGGTFQTDNIFTINATQPDASDIVGTSHSVTVRDKFSCNSVTENNIIIPAVAPFLADAGSDITMCEGQLGVLLNASGGIYYTWTSSPADGLTYLSSSTVANPTVSNAIPSGTYIFTVTAQDQPGITPACQGTDNMTLTVNQRPGVTATANTYSACNTTAIQLNATVTDGGVNPTYLWTPSANLSSATIANPVFTPGVGSYLAQAFTVTVTNDNGCPVSVSTPVVEIFPLPVITSGVIVNASCGGSNGSATVSASSPGTDTTPSFNYQWDAAAGNQTTATATNLAAGTYTVTVTDVTHGCSSTKQVTIGVDADTTSPTAVCQNLSVTLDGTGNATITPQDIDAESSDNCTAAGSLVLSLDKTTFNAGNIGVNTVILTVTDAAGNSSTCTATVTVSFPANCNITGSRTIWLEQFPDANNTQDDPAGDWATSVNSSYFSVQSQAMRAVNQSAASTWTSESIDIRSWTNLNIKVGTWESGTMDTDDYIAFAYSVNGGTFQPFVNNGSIYNDYSGSSASPIYACTNVPDGNSVVIRITVKENSNEYHYFDNIHLTGDPAMEATATITNVSCNGGANGAIEVAVTKGVVPYTYAWSTSNGSGLNTTSEDQTGLTAGTYNLIVTDANGNASDGFVFTVSQPATDPAIIQKAVSDASVCNPAGGNVIFSIASSQIGVNYELKTTGGASLSPIVAAVGTGNNLNLTLLQDNVPDISTTYKVVGTSSSGCTTLDMTDQAVLTVNTTLVPTGVTSQSFCSSNTPRINNISVTGTGILWYNASSGGSVLPGTTYLVNGTTYYASQTLNGCESPTRLGVTVTVTQTPTILSVTHGAICGSGTTTLYASASAGTVNWYSASTGGVLLHSGTSFTTPTISATTSYWVEASTGGCATPTRSEVYATVYVTPSVVLGTNPVACNGVLSTNLTYSSLLGSPNRYSINFDATAEGAGFADVTDLALPSSPISITTPGAAPSGIYNATFSLKNSSNGCVSANYPITITLSPNTAIDIQPSAPAPVCEGTGMATISVTATGGSLTYQWFVDGTTPLTETAPYSNVTSATLTITNPLVSLNGKQYTVKVSGTCGSPVTSDAVSLNVNASPSAALAVGDASICKPADGNAILTITNAENGVTYELQTLAGASLSPAVIGNGTGANLDLIILQANTPEVTTNYKVVASIAGCQAVELTDQPTVIVDVTTPTFTCPADIIQDIDPGYCSALVSWPIPTVTDNCDSTPTLTVVSNVGETITETIPGTNQATITVGTSVITYQANDAAGNFTTCSFSITVKDLTAPEITKVPDPQTVFCIDNLPVINTLSAFTAAGGIYSDNAGSDCNSVTVSYSDAQVDNVVTRTYTLTDGGLNLTTCKQVFTISQPSVTIGSQNTTTCIGGAFTIISTVTPGAGVVNYQWQSRPTPTSAWSVVTDLDGDDTRYNGTLGSFTEEYRVLVSQSTDFSGTCVPASLPLAFSDSEKPVFQTAYAPSDQILCTVPGQSSVAVPGMKIDDIDVIDNCTLNLLTGLAYSISGAGATTAPGTGINLPEPTNFNVGVSTVTYVVTDAAGNAATHVVIITVNAAPEPVTITFSTEGDQPSQCASYNYLVDNGITQPGFTYLWNVYSGATTVTPVTSGFSISNSNTALATISWSSDLAPGVYTIESVKAGSSGCESRATQQIILQNSFDLQVLGPTMDCKEQATTDYMIGWTVIEQCGGANWNFTWYLFEGILNELPANYTSSSVYYKKGDCSPGTSSYSFEIPITNGDSYNQTGYTLFIVNPLDSGSENNHNYFYLHGIPNTSEISTD